MIFYIVFFYCFSFYCGYRYGKETRTRDIPVTKKDIAEEVARRLDALARKNK